MKELVELSFKKPTAEARTPGQTDAPWALYVQAALKKQGIAHARTHMQKNRDACPRGWKNSHFCMLTSQEDLPRFGSDATQTW